jgi:hypothetical protein
MADAARRGALTIGRDAPRPDLRCTPRSSISLDDIPYRITMTGRLRRSNDQ